MKKLLIIFLIILILLETFFLFKGEIVNGALPERTVPVGSVTGSVAVQERSYWTKVIEQVGPEKAYAEFKQQYRPMDFGTQHMAAHIVGALLYKKGGIGGLSICDSDFSYGCYHSFFGQVLADKGTDVIKALDDECLKKFGTYGSGCQHGIGHGVMEFFGPRRLLDALVACAPTTEISNIAGCTSGVFMEYNVPIVITESEATATVRPMDPTKPYEPCPTLPEKYRESCYYSIGQWWNQTEYYRQKWKEMGLLCKNAPDQNAVEECYLGLGNIVAPDSLFTPDKAVLSCKQMPDMEGEIVCRAGASWSFDAMPEYKTLAPLVCEDLSGDLKAECRHRANILDPSLHND